MGVLVSYSVAGREPCGPDGDAEMPSIRLVLYRENRGRRQCQSGGRAVRPGRGVMKLLPYSGLCVCWRGVLVSCLVPWRKPCGPGGDAEMPSIRLVLYRENRGRRKCQSGGRAVRPGRGVMKLLPYSGLCVCWRGVLVSCLVPWRKPCGPGGDAEMPSMRLVQYWGTEDGGAVPVWLAERKLQPPGDEAVAVLCTWSAGGGCRWTVAWRDLVRMCG
jgi:hypothetical protein